MILSDLASPAEAGFAKAGNRHPSPDRDPRMGFFGIMREEDREWRIVDGNASRIANCE
jgi:hypothetical protein